MSVRLTPVPLLQLMQASGHHPSGVASEGSRLKRALANQTAYEPGSNDCFWHKADITMAPPNVRFWGRSGHSALTTSRQLMTQSGRAIKPASQR
jgi:hypothetical protein